jgi:hypothetical protein
MPLPNGAAEPSLKRQFEPNLQALSTHITALTENHTLLPMALAQAIAGATEWEWFGLLSGSSITTALSLFCSQYSSENWGSLLRQELPELTDEDIEFRVMAVRSHKSDGTLGIGPGIP